MGAMAGMPRVALGAVGFVCAMLTSQAAMAQTAPVSTAQRATAEQVAQQGIPLAELAADAPDTYVIKRGDTLWGISGMYLKRPWRWPELWGMNMQAIANPHLIFPGQTLYLEKKDGYARLSTRATASGEPETVRVSPRTRTDSLSATALPTLKQHLIEPFLAEPLVVDEQTLLRAARVVATMEDRVLMGPTDRIYARGDAANPLRAEPGEPRQYRIFRDAVALKDPASGAILGYEAHYLARPIWSVVRVLKRAATARVATSLNTCPPRWTWHPARKKFVLAIGCCQHRRAPMSALLRTHPSCLWMHAWSPSTAALACPTQPRTTWWPSTSAPKTACSPDWY